MLAPAKDDPGHIGEVATFTVYGKPGNVRLQSSLSLFGPGGRRIARSRAVTNGSGFHRASACLQDAAMAMGVYWTTISSNDSVELSGDAMLKAALGALAYGIGHPRWTIVEAHG